MVGEFSVPETHGKEPRLFHSPTESKASPLPKLCVLSVSKFSEREISRQLAGLCQLLLRQLARDFNIPQPEAVLLVPALSSERVELKIVRRD